MGTAHHKPRRQTAATLTDADKRRLRYYLLNSDELSGAMLAKKFGVREQFISEFKKGILNADKEAENKEARPD